MHTLWFLLLAAVITVYVVLDGFDLGAGALFFLLGRGEEERGRISSAIGPVWDGNETWLVVGGGVLFLSFPRAYAGAFSGLYFGLMIVLWLLIGRGLAIEFRHQIDHPLWHQATDFVFAVASALLAIVLGVALGNVVRGVPIGANGYFHLPLFSILNWYALLVGLLALLVLSAQSASFLAVRAAGTLGERARKLARRLVPAQIIAGAIMVWPTYAVRHHMLTGFGDHPWTIILPAAGAIAILTEIVAQARGRWGRAFVANCAAITALLATAAAGVYPDILPARQGHPFSLTIDNAAAAAHSLDVAIVWFPIGMVLAACYFTYAYRTLFRSPPA
ncbi:MAG TPA: cytochrome d ubiquinol oxidase subunit II [Solirubrobacteraceae bacterium]|jgi:cytochrome d ubiquinol oxidase subunit II|nr:cytochrome d ubiquinol oxidase subunit II [Solirubrobacteraceae bacterium]